MNLRTTIVLIILAGIGAGVWLSADWLAPRVGLAPKPIDPAGAGSPAVLDEQLARDNVKRIEVQGADQVVLERSADGSWVLLRASGTEALIRIYSEAADQQAVDSRLHALEDIVGIRQHAGA